MPHYGTVTVRDYGDETSTTKINFGAVTAVSIGGLLTQWGNWRTALGNIILGYLGKETLVMDSTVLSNESPPETQAQVELKWLFTYEGDTSKKKYRFEIPTADTDLLIPGTDMIDMTDTAVATFVTATETLGRSPDSDTETITVLDGRLVGRNI